MGHIEQTPYASVDGGPRLMRSVIPMRSMHGRAIHPTEKELAADDPEEAGLCSDCREGEDGE